MDEWQQGFYWGIFWMCVARILLDIAVIAFKDKWEIRRKDTHG